MSDDNKDVSFVAVVRSGDLGEGDSTTQSDPGEKVKGSAMIHQIRAESVSLTSNCAHGSLNPVLRIRAAARHTNYHRGHRVSQRKTQGNRELMERRIASG